MNLSHIEEIIRKESKTCIKSLQLLSIYYKQVEGLNPFKSAEKAENNLTQLIDLVQSRIQYESELNIYTLFKQIDKNTVQLDLEYFSVTEILKALNTITWQEFEDFCGIVMRKCFNASETYVTQRRSDGGVDFEGKIPFKSQIVGGQYGWIEFFGQAKKYSGNVPRTDVDAFTAFANRKKRDNQYPAQLFLFFTTSDFISSAKSEIKKNNFIGLNGMQLATLIYYHRATDSYGKGLEEFINF